MSGALTEVAEFPEMMVGGAQVRPAGGGVHMASLWVLLMLAVVQCQQQQEEDPGGTDRLLRSQASIIVNRWNAVGQGAVGADCPDGADGAMCRVAAQVDALHNSRQPQRDLVQIHQHCATLRV